MYCQECGKKIGDNAAFCRFCGKSVVNDGISNHVTASENGNESENGDGNKGLINLVKKIEIAVIIVLAVIVLKLSAGGTKSEVIEAAESTAMEEKAMSEETEKASVLDDIIGDWYFNGSVGSDTYAATYSTAPSDRESYLRVEAEGLKAIGATPDTIYYMIGVEDIAIQEEDGIKYYTYSAKMYSYHLRNEGLPPYQKIGIRLYLDEEAGDLICEYNVPEDGFWVKRITFERIDSIEEDMRKIFSKDYDGPIIIR